MKRHIHDKIKTDLDRKIVLLSGPRQVGKTTLAKALYPDSSEYFNMDSAEHRLLVQKQAWRRDCDLVIFDELHKVRKWKSWIKGIYDTEGVRPRLLVTGSARLDVYRKGGDSLAGRFYSFRLHPLSVAEVKGKYAAETAEQTIAAFSSLWMKYFLMYDPVPALTKVKCPVLAIFGEKDLQVAPSQNKKPIEDALKKGANKDYKIVIIPKANHLFQEAVTGSPSEYATLKKEFIPGFLETVSEWILLRVTVVK